MHEKYTNLLQEYIDGTINPLEKIILEEHLLSCMECRRELNQLKLLDWELQHQPVIELPAELAKTRMAAVKTHLAVEKTGQQGSTGRELWRLQLQILHHTSSFMGYNPVNRVLNRTVKRSFSMLGKVAGTTIKKRNPLLARLVPGRV